MIFARVYILRWAAIMALGFVPSFFSVSVVPILAQEKVVFEDRFDGSLQPGWIWRRENPNARRFAGGALEIEVEPFAESEAHNVLVRPANFRGKGTFRIETKVTCLEKPDNQYQQGGLYWMQGDRVAFKLVHEFVDGRMYIFPGKIPVDSTSVNLRIISKGDDIVAEFCCDGESSWRRIYEGKLSKSGDDEIGIQCWHGPTDRKSPPWMRFQNFRIVREDD